MLLGLNYLVCLLEFVLWVAWFIFLLIFYCFLFCLVVVGGAQIVYFVFIVFILFCRCFLNRICFRKEECLFLGIFFLFLFIYISCLFLGRLFIVKFQFVFVLGRRLHLLFDLWFLLNLWFRLLIMLLFIDSFHEYLLCRFVFAFDHLQELQIFISKMLCRLTYFFFFCFLLPKYLPSEWCALIIFFEI